MTTETFIFRGCMSPLSVTQVVFLFHARKRRPSVGMKKVEFRISSLPEFTGYQSALYSNDLSRWIRYSLDTTLFRIL
jgi:hypothetical protein